jgi:hypothetical protein
MPSPKRKPPLASIDIRICRREVQRVLRAYHRLGNINAPTCIGMFLTLINPNDPILGPITASYLSKFPEMFAALVGAIIKSDKRIKLMPLNSPERLIEERFSELRDIGKYRKLAEALPGASEGVLAQVRRGLTRSNKILDYWQQAFTRESGDESYSFVFSSDGKAIDIYVKPEATA